ncbi:hypothetical protein ACFLR7_06795 [Acidobacteriota bacterium]
MNKQRQRGRDEIAFIRYTKLLDLWQDADPALPEVADARESVAGLR